MSELFSFLFSSILPQQLQVSSSCLPLLSYAVRIKISLTNRHRHRLETMQLHWDSLEKNELLIILLIITRLFHIHPSLFLRNTSKQSPSTYLNDL